MYHKSNKLYFKPTLHVCSYFSKLFKIFAFKNVPINSYEKLYFVFF